MNERFYASMPGITVTGNFACTVRYRGRVVGWVNRSIRPIRNPWQARTNSYTGAFPLGGYATRREAVWAIYHNEAEEA